MEELAVTPGVELVTIVGRTRAALERAREQRAGGPGAGAAGADAGSVRPRTSPSETADASDRDTVIEIMRRHDVALGALGPFYIFEEPMVKAAIAAGTPYLSLCDDADATAAALKHDAAARAAGVTIVTGLGWTPGLTNILALRAAARLDKTTSVTIAWTGSAAESGGHAVALHTLHIFNGKVTTFAERPPHGRAGGQRTRVHRVSGAVRAGTGVPRRPSGAADVAGAAARRRARVALKGGLVEPTLHQLAVLTGRAGLAATHGMRTYLARLLVPFIPLLSRFGPKRPAISGVVVRVTGEKDGETVTLESAATAPMRALTSIPLAIGALWMAQGRVHRPGVLAPDAPDLFPPAPFLDELARRGVPITDTEYRV